MKSIHSLALSLAVLALAGCQAPKRPMPPEPAKPMPAAPGSSQKSAKPTPGAASVPPPALHLPAPQPPLLTGKDVYERLVARFADPPCIEDRVVQRWERTYGRWPPRLRVQLEAILPLMAMTLEEIETHHLAGEFALLPIVESWYRPEAGTPRSAYGMWQFTSATARHHGLRIVPGFDERLAPRAATRAAMAYLSTLQNRFGDWKLANMAFNAGEYRLAKALARQADDDAVASAASHLPAGLSLTTYEHLAKVQALACLIAQPERFGLELPLDSAIEPLQAVPLPDEASSLDLVAQRADIDGVALRRLNPAFQHGRAVVDARRELLLPRSQAIRVARLAAQEPSAGTMAVPTGARASQARGRKYRVERGDTLSVIAQRHGLKLRDLLRWNGLEVRSLLHPGQMLRLEP